MGFGICISIATSANLIAYFAIPAMMEGVDAADMDLYTRRLRDTFWLNVWVCGGTLVLFVLTSIPLMKSEFAYLRVQRKMKKQQQSGGNVIESECGEFTRLNELP